MKSRSVSPKPRRAAADVYVPRGWFDYLVLVLHEASDFAVRQAVLLPRKTALAYARPASARRDDVLCMSMTPQVMRDPTGVDITERPRSVAQRA